MAAPDNPNPTPKDIPDEYSTHECPICGAEVKQLPAHLRNTCEQ